MAHSIESLCEDIKQNWEQRASEIERTVPTKDTCLNHNGMCPKKCDFCLSFIPLTWDKCIFYNGEWWS